MFRTKGLIKLLGGEILRTVKLRARSLATSTGYCNVTNKPISSDELPRMCGMASMFRLPFQKGTEGLDVCVVGVPIDWGTSNRSGARFGPRQIRTESVYVKPRNIETGAMPYESLNIADVGDVNMTPYDTAKCVSDITREFRELMKNGCRPVTLGGDHTITYPILKAFKEKYGPVALIHIDAHQDVADHGNHCPVMHSTPFRRAQQDGLLLPDKVFQMGIRGAVMSAEDRDWSVAQGFHIFRSSHLRQANIPQLMQRVRGKIGDSPLYISFDIDALDPSVAPGTGAPEIAGLFSHHILDIIRGCRGLNLVGADVVEVSPPYDRTGNTAITAANFIFEMLCVFPGVKYDEDMVVHKMPDI